MLLNRKITNIMSNNGSGSDSTMIVVLLGGVMVMCLSSCCSSIMTAYANECDTSGSLSFLAGDWYWTTFPTGLLGCTETGSGTGGDTSGGTSGGDTTTSGGGGTGSSSCTPGITGDNTYQTRVEKNGKWSCADGYQDTGCTWGDVLDGNDQGARQCRKLKSGEKGEKKSVCNLGTESENDYRTRRKTSSGRWECPKGWMDTKCGLVTNSDGTWLDGSDKGMKQCRKLKNGTTSSGSGSVPKSGCITIISEDNNDKTNRPKAEHTLCMTGSENDKKIGNLRTIKGSDGHDWNDRITHVSVPKGITLNLWDNDNWKGKQTENIVGPVTRKALGEVNYRNGQGGNINIEATTLHFWRNNDTSSSSGNASNSSSKGGCNYSSKSDKVWVFDKSKYGGNCQSFGNGTHNLALSSVGSLKIPKNSKRRVKLCQEYNQGGSCKYFVKDTSNMFSSHNNAKSVKVYKSGGTTQAAEPKKRMVCKTEGRPPQRTCKYV